jgi:acyl-CoA thioesterase-1
MKYALPSAFVLIAAVLLYGTFFTLSQNKKNETVSRLPSAVETSTPKTAYTIVAFGDSLTAGYGVSLSESYPAQLEALLAKKYADIRVINMGVSGETTTGGLERVDFILQQKPSLVLLGLGANDMLRGTPPSTTKQNLTTIISRFQEADVPIVLLGMQSASSNGTTFTKEFDAIYPTLAASFSIPLVPFFLDGVALVPTLNTADGIHPNKDGYARIIEQNILPVTTPLLDVVIQ